MWILLSALAAEPETCPPASELVSAERWLRAASLDLRGTVPTPEEYQLLTSPDALPEDLLDAWMQTEAFVERAVIDHRKRLWNRMPDNDVVPLRHILQSVGGVYQARQKSDTFRGARNVSCGDQPAQDLDGDGAWDVNDQGQEGWIEVHPFWESDPTVTIQVCAFDAQTAAVSPSGNDCSTSASNTDPGCGCGPELQWCLTRAGEQTIQEAIGYAMDRRIAEVVRSNRPYTDLFFEDLLYINGPLAHLYQHLTDLPAGMRFDLPQIDVANVPDLAFDDVDTWVALPTQPESAGMFTDPAFLLRFMTNRARVNRFYEDFLCSPLTAPATGISVSSEVTPDLANRGGCSSCHALIEPAGLYWGRFTEGGASFLPPESFPAFDQDCYDCSIDSATVCPDRCDAYIVNPTDDRYDPYIGSLQALQFRPDAQHGRIDAGPGALVESQIANGRIPECLTRKTATWLLGRSPAPDDDPWIDDWNAALLSSGWDYRTLVKQIVTSDTYRRVH